MSGSSYSLGAVIWGFMKEPNLSKRLNTSNPSTFRSQISPHIGTYQPILLVFCCIILKSVNPKGHQPWIFTEWTDAEAEALILWPPDANSWLIGKDPGAGKDWRQAEKGRPEDKMVGWHHWLSRHGFEQTSGESEGQGSLACCSPWGHKEPYTTEQLNNSSNPKTSNFFSFSLSLKSLVQKKRPGQIKDVVKCKQFCICRHTVLSSWLYKVIL